MLFRSDVSKEFCAGCHVDNTANIGVCKIVGEESIGSDSRRITAKTGYAAYEDFAHEHGQLDTIAAAMKQKGIKDIEEKVAQQLQNAKALQKELDQLNNKIFALRANEWIQEKVKAGAFDLLIKKVQGMDGKAMKDIVANLKAKDSGLLVLLIAADDKKVVFVAGAGKDAVAKGANAGQIVKMAANVCGGNGGGKPDLAQAGGKDASKVDEAIELVRSYVPSIA